MSEQDNVENPQGHFFAGDQKKAVITATRFLQSEIAKYLGNDGILTPDEEAELDDLKIQLGVGNKSYERLKKLARQELFYFRRDDVLGFCLGHVDRSKLYVDAERISVRISLVDRWIKELEDILASAEDKRDRTSRIKLTVNLWKWVYQDLWDESVNEWIERTLDSQSDIPESEFEPLKREIDRAVLSKVNGQKGVDYDQRFAKLFKKAVLAQSPFYKKIDDLLQSKKETSHSSERAKLLYAYVVRCVLEILDKDDSYKCQGVIDYKFVEKALKELSVPFLTNEWASIISHNEHFQYIVRYNGYSKEKFLKAIDRPLDDSKNEEDCWPLDMLKIMGENELVNKDVQKIISMKVEPEKKDAMNPQKHLLEPVVFLLIVVATLSWLYSTFFTQTLEFKDSRDGTEYRMTEIGGVKWMAENLRYRTRNSLESSHGNLYKWNEAILACPAGWRLPTQDEWQQLIDAIGGVAMGRQLKSRKWDKKATDSTDFTALADGFVDPVISENVNEKGVSAQWWTYTLQNSNEALFVRMHSDDDSILIRSSKMDMAYSVRCVKIDSNIVKPRKTPASTSENVSHDISGIVETFKLQNDVWVPVIKLPNGKRVMPYTPEQYAVISLKIASNNSNIVADLMDGKAPQLVERSKASRRPLFLQGSSVTIKRFFEKNYAFKKDSWRPDSIWIKDSVKVQGDYVLSDLNSIGNIRCDAKYEALLEQDSLTTINFEKPCSELQIGEPYKLTIHFTLKRNQQDKENSELNYRIWNVQEEKVIDSKKE
jgi:uncharacterized protein (TIGR02145 family)